MTRRLAVCMVLLAAACGGGRAPAPPTPATAADAVVGFLDAVRLNDSRKMSELWGDERGGAVAWMAPDELEKRLTVIQRYLAHSAYRIVDGPAPLRGQSDRVTFRVELRRGQCLHVQPIDLVRARQGGWIVWDVHLEAAGTPPAACSRVPPGTRD